MRSTSLVVGLCSLAINGQAVIVQDGGFESPQHSPGTYYYLSAPPTPPSVYQGVPRDFPNTSPWTFVDGGGVVHPPGAGFQGDAAYEGHQFAFLQMEGSSISQLIYLAGGSYQLDFAQQGRHDYEPCGGQLTYQVLLDNSVLGEFTSTPFSDWRAEQITFSAPAGDYTLSFKGISTPPDLSRDQTVYLDGVSVAPVPEPSTYLAGLSALGMLALFGWRNRK